MRILRGKSNLEVSSQGFALFVVGLVLATFIGGALRTQLSSNEVHRRIVARIKTLLPNHQFSIDRTEVLLSRGAWPGLGVKLYGLKLTQEVCGKLSFQLELPETTLPLSVWSLLRGKWKLGDVEIDKGSIHLDYRSCQAPGASASGGTAVAHEAAPARASAKPNSPAPASGSKPARPIVIPRVNTAEISKAVETFHIRDFTVTYEGHPTWKAQFTSLELETGDETSLQANVNLRKSLPFGELSHEVELEAKSDGRMLEWTLNTDFKEGHVLVAGSVDQESQSTRVTTVLKQVPLKDFLSEMHLAEFIDRELKLKAAWLSCSADWEGNLNDYTAAPVAVHDCKVEGGYGRADLEKTQVWLGAAEPFRAPAQFRIRQLQIQPLLEALGREVLPAVVSKLGNWSGNVAYLNKKSWQLDGYLENAEIVFSNQSVRGKQGLDKLHTRLQMQSGEIHGLIDEIAIRDGEVKGLLEFRLDEDWRNGRFNAKIEQARLSPAIQKLMVGGAVANLSLNGQGLLVEGELADWDGQMTLQEITGLGWRAEDTRVKSFFRPGKFTVETATKRIVVTPSWRYYSSLKGIAAEGANEAVWRDVVAKMDIAKSGGQIHSATAILDDGAQPWSAKGQWVRDGELTGTVRVGRGSRPSIYSVRGEKGALNVSRASASPASL